ncbi:uncharacterized protein LOC110736915 [Chenopodium quinoa]|uniref:uncharacterized protein LOC110736915 n=1 Tax=Chenopodium quinoa TaxID=63459 RepID=UPI000B77698A|nr:uncharacterized protein LOC110736915 [Chenopodium quinoa]
MFGVLIFLQAGPSLLWVGSSKVKREVVDIVPSLTRPEDGMQSLAQYSKVVLQKQSDLLRDPRLRFHMFRKPRQELGLKDKLRRGSRREMNSRKWLSATRKKRSRPLRFSQTFMTHLGWKMSLICLLLLLRRNVNKKLSVLLDFG